MENKHNCLICGSEIVYTEISEEMECYFCKQKNISNAKCSNGHYVCDHCHGLGAYEIIKRYCLQSTETNPIKMAEDIMKHASIKMHGPEHHFLIPAVLITAYYNFTNNREAIAEKLNEAEKRAKNVLGGFCGFYGNCGAGVGTGIFISLITGANPLSTNEWRLSNLMTSKSLFSIAENGGPRCCKRDSFIAIDEAVKFVSENLGISMDKSENIKCSFNHMNPQCIKAKCKFYDHLNDL